MFFIVRYYHQYPIIITEHLHHLYFVKLCKVVEFT